MGLRDILRCRKLCSTVAGNDLYLLTITSPALDPGNSSASTRFKIQPLLTMVILDTLRARRGVVISARVHPGETNASWMIKGVIDFLTGSSFEARILRDRFVFKIIPMLNPDGVILGMQQLFCRVCGCFNMCARELSVWFGWPGP